MTLRNVKSQKEETQVPYADDYKKILKRMSYMQIETIYQHINDIVDAEMRKPKNRYLKLAKVTGKHWGGTPFQIIYDQLNVSEVQAAQIAGSMLIDVLIRREERWNFLPAEKDGIDYVARQYFMENPE